MKIVLFDLDGTLVKAGGAGRRALNRAVRRLHGVRDVCSRFSLAGRMDRHNFRLAVLHATGKPPSRGLVKAVEDAYLAALPRTVRVAVRAGRYEEIPGCTRLLEALSRRKNVLLGLGTGNVREGARIKLQPSGMSRFFSFGGYGKDGSRRSQMLRAAVRRAERRLRVRVRPRDVFVIGDTAEDVRGGKEAGYRTAAVTGGFGDASEIKAAGPEFSRPDYRDLSAWLRWITGATG